MNTLSRYLLNYVNSKFLRNYYGSLDELPIINWNRIHEGESLNFLHRTDKVYISKKKPGKIKGYFLGKLWRSLQEQYVEKFGFSEDFLAICRKQKEIILLRKDRALNNDKSLNLFIKVAEDQLEEMKKSCVGGSFWELKGHLDKAGFNIILTQTSVVEFYTHVNTLMKQSKAMQSNE